MSTQEPPENGWNYSGDYDPENWSDDADSPPLPPSPPVPAPNLPDTESIWIQRVAGLIAAEEQLRVDLRKMTVARDAGILFLCVAEAQRDELLTLLREVQRYLLVMIEAGIIARPRDLMAKIDMVVSGETSC